MKLFRVLKSKTSLISIIVVFIVILFTDLNNKHWKVWNRVISWDIISYYAYLPASFIYDDISLDFVDDPSDTSRPYVFWPSKTAEGKNVIKTSMGLSYAYMPFFFIGHLYALNSNFTASGFSEPYKFMLLMSSLFFLILGLIYFRKILKLYFNEHAVAISILLVVFATNLYFYSSFEGPMSHVYEFALTSIFIWCTIKWYRKPTLGISLLLGLLAGWISLIRPTDIVVALLFIFWDISRFKDLGSRLLLLTKKWPLILSILIIAFVVWIPQLLYWKMQTGHYLYFSYGLSDERFFFNNPQIINGLFSWRKGLFVYTPIMFVAVAGMFYVRKHNKSFAWLIPAYFFLNTYIIFSWWCWWYGGCHGARSFIDFYTILFIPITAILHEVFIRKKVWKKIAITVVMGAFIYVGFFQTIQYYKGFIHWDAMTKEAYFRNFLSNHNREGYPELLREPDYEKARKGNEDYWLN